MPDETLFIDPLGFATRGSHVETLSIVPLPSDDVPVIISGGILTGLGGHGSGSFGAVAMGSGNIPGGTGGGDVSSQPTDCDDSIPPVVTNFFPPSGSQITSTQRIQFDVTDVGITQDGLFRCLIIVAEYPATGLQELVHDGDVFTNFFIQSSSRHVIPGGFRYSVSRFGGWLSSPTIRVFATDAGGNQAIP